jgi:hypothetical protein
MYGVAMIVRVADAAMIVAMVVNMPGHEPILPVSKVVQPSGALGVLIRHFDTAFAGMD